MSTLTELEHADLEYVLGLFGDRENLVLDFSDERQYRTAIALQNAGGHTSDTRPGMHAALAELREQHLAEGGPSQEQASDDQGFRTGAQVNDVGPLAGTQQPASNGFTALLNGAWQLNATITVVQPSNPQVLASGSGSQFNQGQYLPLYATPNPGALTKPQMTGIVAYNYQQEIGGRWTAALAKRDVDAGVLADPVVTHPNQHQRGVSSPYIRIALGRGQNTQTDVDYWYWYGTGTTIYAIPWVGYVDLVAPPVTPLVLNQNVFISGTLARSSVDAGGYVNLPDTEVQKLFRSLQPSGNRLAWTLAPPADAPPWGPMGNPITWGTLNWTTGEADYVTIQISVQLQGQAQLAAFTVQSSLDPNDDQVDGTTNIPPLQFLWSCLAAGTPILLADGSSLAIEDVARGTVVRRGDGSEAVVQSTTQFRHIGDVLRLCTDGGQELVLSHNHLVATPEGLRPAGQLAVGATVNALHGTARLVAAEVEPFNGLLCNLSLSAPDATPDPADTVFATSIEVGDYELQVSYEAAWRSDPERILAQLEPQYHADYRAYLGEVSANA